MTITPPQAHSYTVDGVRAGLSTYPFPKPRLDDQALVESCRVQAQTWVTSRFRVEVPDELSGPGALADLIAEIQDAAENDAEEERLRHLDNAYEAALHAYHERGSGYLLGTLFSLISAGATIVDAPDDPRRRAPFEDRMPVVDERALIETVRVQLNTWAPALLKVPTWAPGEIASVVDLSDVIALVADAAQAAYGHPDDDSMRGMAHLANARAHSLKAGYGHGAPHVLAALDALVLATANLIQ
ncbi:hypothetical protein ACFWGI_06200 [Streptomyces niveus]|uniref:hypothetical protein n=1 Tax=Streptomyces niveus TaxID=193462 RepID=UPI00365A239F